MGADLLRAGVRAVITLPAAGGAGLLETFLRVLLEALRADGHVDTAMVAARRAILDLPNPRPPALYLGSRATRLFQTGPQRAAIMVPAPPKDFIIPVAQLETLVGRLIAPGAKVVALTGLPGAGKSGLASNALADERVKAAFPEARLWVTLGSSPALADALLTLIAALGGDPPGTGASHTALSAALAALLSGRRALIVIDDVWSAADLAPFVVPAQGCVWLIITRDKATLPADTDKVEVGPLAPDEAVAVLSAGLNLADSERRSELDRLARRLGYWPLALRLANGLLRERVVARRQPLPDVLAYMHTALDQQGPAAFDSSAGSIVETFAQP